MVRNFAAKKEFMESNFDKMMKRPLRTMKFLFVFYFIATLIVAACAFILSKTGEMNFGLFFAIVLTATMTVVTRYGYDELTKGTKTGWMIAMVLSAHLIPSIFLPLGVYSFTGLLNKDVRNQCLDGAAGDETVPTSSFSAT